MVRGEVPRTLLVPTGHHPQGLPSRPLAPPRAYRSAADATRGSGRSRDLPDHLSTRPVEHRAIRVDDDVPHAGALLVLPTGAAPLGRHRFRAEVGEQLIPPTEPVQA